MILHSPIQFGHLETTKEPTNVINYRFSEQQGVKIHQEGKSQLALHLIMLTDKLSCRKLNQVQNGFEIHIYFNQLRF